MVTNKGHHVGGRTGESTRSHHVNLHRSARESVANAAAATAAAVVCAPPLVFQGMAGGGLRIPREAKAGIYYVAKSTDFAGR